MTRQDVRRAQTRGALMQATHDLLLEVGLHAVTIKAIVERADVARGTFYVYFQSIDEVCAALLTRALFVEADSHA